ncbi:10989_t:CDS:1 [Funneliformis geosporum]|nr:10989_t:CDS:1 [Funneliformis geosporum]
MEAVEKLIKELQIFLSDKVVEDFRKFFKDFDEVQPATFESYQNIVEYDSNFFKLANNFINEGLINFQESEINNINQQFIYSLLSLKMLVNEMAYVKRIDIIRDVLNSSHKTEMFFGNSKLTKEEINKRCRKLALYFHPDKTCKSNSPTFLKDEHKYLGDKLFGFVQNFKESLSNNDSENEDLAYHEKYANQLWKITIDYRNAAKGQRDNLNLLKKDDIKELSSEELERQSVNHGMIAYKEYREACKIVDKAKLLKDQVRLRGNMTLCLYVSNKLLEAQLYALSAIKLQFKYPDEVTQDDLTKAKKIFDKVRGKNATEDTHKSATSNNTKALVN